MSTGLSEEESQEDGRFCGQSGSGVRCANRNELERGRPCWFAGVVVELGSMVGEGQMRKGLRGSGSSEGGTLLSEHLVMSQPINASVMPLLEYKQASGRLG